MHPIGASQFSSRKIRKRDSLTGYQAKTLLSSAISNNLGSQPCVAALHILPSPPYHPHHQIRHAELQSMEKVGASLHPVAFIHIDSALRNPKLYSRCCSNSEMESMHLSHSSLLQPQLCEIKYHIRRNLRILCSWTELMKSSQIRGPRSTLADRSSISLEEQVVAGPTNICIVCTWQHQYFSTPSIWRRSGTYRYFCTYAYKR